MHNSSAPDSPLIAWVDESVVVGGDDRPGAYTLAAVIADDDAIEGLRDDLRALTERKIVRLHWVAESTKRRDLIVETVAALGVVAIVVVGSRRDGGQPRGAEVAAGAVRAGCRPSGRGPLESAKAGPHHPVGIPASLLTKQRVASYPHYATSSRRLSCDIHTSVGSEFLEAG